MTKRDRYKKKIDILHLSWYYPLQYLAPNTGGKMLTGIEKKFRISFLGGGDVEILTDPVKIKRAIEENNEKTNTPRFSQLSIAATIIMQHCSQKSVGPKRFRQISSMIDWASIEIGRASCRERV